MAHIKERSTSRGTKYDVRWGNRSFTARSLEDALLAQIAVERGDEPARVLPEALTFGEFMDAFDERWRIGKAFKTIEVASNARTRLRPLDGVRLSQLRAALVEDMIASLAGTVPRAAQQTLAHLQKGLRSAQARGHAFDARILTLKAPTYESKLIRFLTWDEVENLQSRIDERVNRIVPFAALTGMRKTELFELRDTQVDVAQGCVTLRKTKTGKPRKVWLSDTAKQLVLEQLVVRTPNQKGLVFPTRTGHTLDSRFERQYREAVVHAGLHGATFHSLRHTCAALMIRAECNPLEIAEQLGHLRGGRPDPTMIWKVYGWLFEGATSRAVLKLDRVIAVPQDEAETA